MEAQIHDLAEAKRKKTARQGHKKLETAGYLDDEDEDEGYILCERCGGVEFAVNICKESASILNLVCVSTECDGDSYTYVTDGVLDPGFTFTPDDKAA